MSCPREGYNATLQSSFKTLTSRSGDYVQATARTRLSCLHMHGEGVGGRGNKEVQTCHNLHSCCPAPFSFPSSVKPFFDCKGINYKYALLDNFPLFLLLPNLLELPPPALYSPPRHPSPFPYLSSFPPCLPAGALPHSSKHSY